MTISVGLGSETYGKLIEEGIQEATKLLRIIGAAQGRQLFPYFFRSCVARWQEQCKGSEYEKLIAWLAPFVQQVRTPGVSSDDVSRD